MPGSIAGHGGRFFLAGVPTAALKHHDQKELGKERFDSACTSIITAHHGKKSEQELRQRPQRSVAYWITQPVLLQNSGQPAQDGITHYGLPIKKSSSRLAHSSALKRHFFY